MDVVQNGHCICQRDFQNDISSKPPLYTWLAALTTIPLGRTCRFSIYFPNALAVLITAVIIFFAGRRLFGQSTGCIAALFYMISAPGLKQLCLARTDPLFTLLVAITGVLAYRAWILQKGWT
jgi:4-amino-4-deoxy-L-arabinose transferase-like glycosyltransferase